MSKDAICTIDPAALPDDPALLKQLACRASQTLIAIAFARKRLTQLEACSSGASGATRPDEGRDGRHLCAATTARAASVRSRGNCLLFGQVIEQMPLDEASIAEEAGEKLVTRRVKNRDQHGRQQLPEHLERIEIEHDLDDAEKACPACGERALPDRRRKSASSSNTSRPASRCSSTSATSTPARSATHDGYNPNIAAAAKPPQPIDKGLPGPGLLAYVVGQQAGRSPAAVPAGTHLRAAAGARRPQHDVRLDGGGGRIGQAAGGADARAGEAVAA